jgi:thiamine biosynthesis lipoprotein
MRVLSTIVFAITVLSAQSPHPLHHHASSRLSMGCVYAIEAYGGSSEALPGILNEAFDEIDRIDRLMSHYKPGSELSRLNREAAHGPVSVSPELFDFIVEALRYGRESFGAFDVTVGPLMKAWGFFRGEGRVPSEAELASARRLVGSAHVVVDRGVRTIAFDTPGVELDLGGIAKGYAVDRVVRLLRRRQIEAALVSAGGSTIYALGAPPGRKAWAVEIQDPVATNRTAVTVDLTDRALSIAGGSEKSFEAGGRTYSHIMDPRTGRPVEGVLTVAVLTTSGTAGDALDDAFFVLGPDRGRPYLQQIPGTEVLYFLPDGQHGWKVTRQRAP